MLKQREERCDGPLGLDLERGVVIDPVCADTNTRDAVTDADEASACAPTTGQTTSFEAGL